MLNRNNIFHNITILYATLVSSFWQPWVLVLCASELHYITFSDLLSACFRKYAHLELSFTSVAPKFSRVQGLFKIH